jgi:hypothetical protein
LPYTIRKQSCKQADGDRGAWTLSFVDKKGGAHRACHTSKKRARGAVAAIEMEGVEAVDEGLSWVPPLSRMIEGIEDDLAALAGQHPLPTAPIRVGDRVQSRAGAGARIHAGRPLTGRVVGVRRVAGDRWLYDVSWDPLPLTAGSSWADPDDPEEMTAQAAGLEAEDLVERGIPASRIRVLADRRAR